MASHSDAVTAPVDLVFSGDFELEASVEAAWPHVLSYPTWQHFPIVEHLSGTPGGEGEVVRLKKETDGYTIGPYLARTLRLDHSNHVVIWKVYLDPEQGDVQGLGGASNVQGNVEFRLTEVAADRSRFTYNLIYEYLLPSGDPDRLEEFRKGQFEDWNTVFETNYGHLKKLVVTG